MVRTGTGGSTKLKRIRLHLKNNAFLYKIFVLFLFVAVIFLFLTLLFFQRVNLIAVDEFERTEAERFSQRVSAVSGQITQLYQNSSNFLSSDTVFNHLKPYDQLTVNDKTKLPSIVKGLLNHQVINAGLLRQCFLLIDEKYIYTAQGMHDFDQYFERVTPLNDYPALFWHTFINSDGPQLALPASRFRLNDREHPVVPFVVSNVHEQRHYKLVNLISIENILNSLASNDAQKVSSTAMIKGGRLFATAGPVFPEDLEVLKNSPDFKVVSASDVLNNEYLLVINRVILANQISQRHQALVYFTELALVLLLFIVVLINIRINSPLRRMLHIVKEQARLTGAQSEHNGSFETLLASNTERMLQLSKAEESYSTYLIQEALFGSESSNHEVIRWYLNEEFRLSNLSYTCVCIHMDLKQSFSAHVSPAEQELLNQQIKAVYQRILGAHFPCYILEYAPAKTCLLLDTGVDRGSIDKALHEVGEIFRYEFSCDTLQIGVGTSVDQILSLHAAFDTAQSAIWWGDDQSRFHITHAAEISYTDTPVITEAELVKIRNCMRSARFDTIKRIIDDIYRRSREEHMLLSSFRTQVVNLYQWGVLIARSSNVDMTSLTLTDFNTFFSGLGDNPGIDTQVAVETLLAFYQQASACFDSSEQKYINTLIKRLKSFIQEHYQENISLDSIAGAFDLSSKYVSRVFKEVEGQRISDYIAACRIDHAKMLLRTTDTSIAEIGSEVGIPSRTTFFRLFKSLEGISPGEYRSSST